VSSKIDFAITATAADFLPPEKTKRQNPPRDKSRSDKRLQAAYSVSERRTCQALGFPHSTHPQVSVHHGRVELRIRLRDLAASRVRYGNRCLHTLLRGLAGQSQAGLPAGH
jgi:hypothetical protein